MTTTALSYIEQQATDVFLSMTGDPLFIGLGLILMVVGTLVFARMGIMVALVALIPMLVIAIVLIPAIRIVGGIILGVILAFGLLRLIGD